MVIFKKNKMFCFVQVVVNFCCNLITFLGFGPIAKVQKIHLSNSFVEQLLFYKFYSNFSGIEKFGLINCMIVMKEVFFLAMLARETGK